MKKILVIEDDNMIKNGVKELLTTVGYKVFAADEGKDGVNLAKEILPDLIVCDIMMPGLNGYEVLKQLNEDNKTSLIPFIFLTAKAEMKDLRIGMELGADDYIVKPFESKTLLNAIEIRLSKKEKNNNTPRKKISKTENKTKKKLTEEDRIFVENSGKLEFIKVNEIVSIVSLGNYCKVTTESGKCELMRKTLAEWQKLLPDFLFLRIHRSYIINLNFVVKISKWSSGTYKVYLKNIAEPFTLSQRYASLIKNKLKL